MTSDQNPIVIVGAARTPLGAFQGCFSGFTAPELGAVAVRAALQRSGVAAGTVSELLMGCVLPAGLGQAPARQAALLAGLPLTTGATSISKVCGSGMKATMLAHDMLLAGRGDAAIAGGMESMTQAPYLLPKARAGHRLGHAQVIDHMFFDGLEDRYGAETQGRLMGSFAEDCARHYGFSRQDQDRYAITSTQRAQHAMQNGAFDDEIAPISRPRSDGTQQMVTTDELPPKVRLDKVPTLKPAFAKDGTVTAANASSIADGAASLVLMRQARCAELGLRPLARIAGLSQHAQEPRWFTTAPVGAIRSLLASTGWSVGDVGLWEINEAFAVVVLAAMQELNLPQERVNVNGGACALGHPIGASGTRIIVTLLHAMRARQVQRGVASLCIGGGEATAVALELL
jgi:acetyl-CoA C-acetyltransferase